MPAKQKKALITGITGQDGSYLAELLLEKETINQDDVIAAIGDRPFEMQENQKEFLRASFARFDQEEDKMKAAEKAKEDDDVVDDEGETVEGDEELQRK